MTKHRIGHSNRYMVEGIAHFSTTDETVEVSCKGLKVITSASALPLSAFAAPDQVSINETVIGTGDSAKIVVPATGTITLTRDAAGTSGLAVAVVLIGY